MTPGAATDINLEDLFAAIDKMDAERFLSFLDADATFRFGSSPAVTGHAGIRAAVKSFFGSFSALRHELRRVIVEGDAIACEGDVTYTRHDGSKITLPFANVFGTRNGLISTYHVYIDIAPLFAE